MKKLILPLIVSLMLVSCVTPSVNQVQVYGTVEEILTVGNHYRVKAWCKSEGRYYKITTDRVYQIGDVIKIKGS